LMFKVCNPVESENARLCPLSDCSPQSQIQRRPSGKYGLVYEKPHC
jgi:hypothetical protein